jgi:polyhydroxyalkanoate synthesis repressor PhaR
MRATARTGCATLTQSALCGDVTRLSRDGLSREQVHLRKRRLIKKYANRRLYDTHESRYITLQDLCRLLSQQFDIQVLAHPADGDVTQSVLLQVMQEQEATAAARLSIPFLTNLIRSYTLSDAGGTARFLERTLETYLASTAVTAMQIPLQVRGAGPRQDATSEAP